MPDAPVGIPVAPFSLLGGNRMDWLVRRRLDRAGSIPFHPKSWASGLGSAKGQSATEFSMVSLLFFLMLFAVMDYGWLMFARMNVQQAIDDGGRYASTGQESGGTGTRISSIISTIQNEISVPGAWNASNLSICSVPPGSTTASCYSSANPSGTAGAAGGPQFTVTISLVTTLPLLTPLVGRFFPSAGYSFTSSTTFQNEPFDPSQTQ
jgi:Flp pilus assembly protein TadG